MRAIGLDLAGRATNPTGFCLLTTEENTSNSDTKLLFSDEELVTAIEAAKPDIIAIDAPFWLPHGPAGRVIPFRNSEQLLLKRGFRPLSPALPTMQELSMRALRLVKVLRERGYRVIEVFPRASEQILGLSKEPRKNQDEYDALLAALTGKAYLEGKYEDLDGIVIPK